MPATRGSRKDSDRAVTPAAEAVRVPAHLAPQGPHKPSICATFTLNCQWGGAATGKKSLASVLTGSLWLCLTLCDAVDCALPGFSVKEGGLQPRLLVAIPFWSTIFPAALASNSPEDLELPEPLQPNQLHHLHTWPTPGRTHVLQGSLRSKPQWMTHM